MLFLVLSQLLHGDMRNNIFIKFLFVIFIALPGVVFSQQLEQGTDQDRETPGPIINPIEPGILLWQLEGFGAFKDTIRQDTLLDFFHIYNPVYKNALTATYVGNYATPYLNNHFFDRRHGIDFFFLQTREAFLLTPEKVNYYNTRTPYTLLDFTQSEHRSRKNETRFNVLHSQNVNPYLNFTFKYDQARSAGQYQNQETKNNYVTLYSSYNKDKWSIHGGFISNSILNNENGGLFEGADLLGEPDTDFLEVNLATARSEFGSTYFYTTGEYKFGRYIKPTPEEEAEVEGEEDVVFPKFKPFAGIIYSFEYQKHLKEYVDEEDSTSNFFDNAYFGEDYNKDSIHFRKISNIVQLKQYENPDRKTSFGKRAYIGQEFINISSPGPVLGVYNRQIKRYSNVYAGGGIFRETGKFWKWKFDGRVFLLGRNAGQTELTGIITKPLAFLGDSLANFNLSGRIENRMPDYFQEEFYSNRIRWNNNLNMEQKMTVNGSMVIPARKLALSANYAIINNFIYNDTLGIPSQDGGQMLVLSAFADKDFNVRDFHFRTRVLWQQSSNEDILHLPDFSAFVSTWYKFIVSKVLFTQIGLDVRYNTTYYADAYSPVTGFFYLQNKTKLGDYPYIDVHANLRLKRTRFFFKMMNVGTEFLNKEYYTTPGYPMNRRTFRFGVAWSFYD